MDNVEEEIKSLEWPEIDFNFDQKPSNIIHVDMKIDEKSIDALLDEIELEFPHVANRLSLLMGHPEFEIAMSNYIVSDRPNRQGFPKHIMTCLLKLSKLHTKTYGHLTNKVIDKYPDKWWN